MKTSVKKRGITLIETLIVVVIVSLLVSVVVGVAKRIDDQSKERLCRTTLTIIGNAIEQFHDFDYEYKAGIHEGLEFPIDCNGFSEFSFENTFTLEFGPDSFPDINPGGDPDQEENSGSEVLHFFLSRIPDCRITLDKVDKSLISNKTGIGEQEFDISGNRYPLYRFIDPWGTTLHYEYYDELETNLNLRDLGKKTFPVITSAGPDKVFGTDDDITNIQQ